MRLLRHEDRLALIALAGALPAIGLAIVWLLERPLPNLVRIPAVVLLLACWMGSAAVLRGKAAFPWRTMSNMLGAVREGDYSIRAKVPAKDDAVGEALTELNLLGESLRARRLEKIEAATLLGKVLEEIDAAIFTFDGEERLKLVNRAGVRLIGGNGEGALGRTAASLGLAEFLHAQPAATVEHTFPGGAGRWAARHTSFRENGMPHDLLLLSDLTRELREQELQAWQRLVRVLGHELNNSLAPVQSIAHSMSSLVSTDPLPEDWREDVIQGLQVIASRSESLSRFVGAYARLARLPKPDPQPVSLRSCLARVTEFGKRAGVEVVGGPELTVLADSDQIEQLLINVLQNAADAVAQNRGAVRVGWQACGTEAELWVEDEGEGLANTSNLFVPFFSTKPGGSGIGLVLCRKIAEGHRGSLTLQNRAGAPGCIARLRLPLAGQA